jgi:WD40 repeat protein
MSLSLPETCCFLTSTRDHPIHLHDLLAPNTRASYPLINPLTEKYLSPHSLLFSRDDPNKFIAGTISQLSFFDLHRPGEPPTLDLKTIPTRRSPQTASTLRGIISALAIDGGVLAAGTFSRQVGLYDKSGTGDTIGTFTVDGDGGGITQLLWSKCGRYLYVVERRSDAVAVYDVRVAGEKVESFVPRAAETNQRMGVDVAYALAGEVVAGGTDGTVSVWKPDGGGTKEAEWKAHDDAVGSAVVHPTGVVMATCSGSRKLGILDEGEGVGSEVDMGWDNSLKVWAL